MPRGKTVFPMILVCVAAGAASPPAKGLGFAGQFSLSLAGHARKAVDPLGAARYLPEFTFEKTLAGGRSLTMDFAANIFGSVRCSPGGGREASGRAKNYRSWIRFSTSQLEARLGLQKINFGSAVLLRPLMWFDLLDPRDPLQITDGVWGLLIKYTFLNNSSIWAWGLYGNDRAKGWETLPTAPRTVEFGGRFQTPVPSGELGLTFHHRRMDISPAPAAPENRFAVDGKWDIGVGIWMEAAIHHYDSRLLLNKYQQALTIGLDYTFGIGGGLHVLGEHFILESSAKAFARGEGLRVSALSLNYPLGLLDTLTGILYYDWKNSRFYRFVNWQRKYDRWSFHVIGFWNPDEFDIYRTPGGENLFAGGGFQIMAVFNH